MTKSEEIIAYFDYILKNATVLYEEWFREATNAFEKQIPKKPVDTDWLYCPS